MKTFQLPRRTGRSRRNPVNKASHAESHQTAVQEALGYPVQTKLKLGAPNDAHEREADAIADRVMAMPDAAVQRKTAEAEPEEEQKHQKEEKKEPDQDEEVKRKALPGEATTSTTTARAIGASQGGGQPLATNERAFFEPRLNANLKQVRVHTDNTAAQLASEFSARAFTVGSDVYFGADEYRPGSREGRHLLGHELAHVLQQSGRSGPTEVQRKLELRPPGKGEYSAFGRAQELIDRLNTISPAIQYELKGNTLTYKVKDAKALTYFDRQMKDFIDRAALVPMRLITHEGLVGGSTLVADSFVSAYVDLDDLMKDDIYSFQSDLLHFITERFQVKNYDKKIGTNIGPQFPAAHRAGKEAEAGLLRDIFKDPSIVFVYEETKPNGTWVNAFKSKDHGYWVFQVVRRLEKAVAGGEMWVRKKDGTKVSMDDFRKERAAAAP